MITPSLYYDPGILQVVEDFLVQAFIAQLVIE
jgi:hypothetical protein